MYGSQNKKPFAEVHQQRQLSRRYPDSRNSANKPQAHTSYQPSPTNKELLSIANKLLFSWNIENGEFVRDRQGSRKQMHGLILWFLELLSVGLGQLMSPLSRVLGVFSALSVPPCPHTSIYT